MNFSILLMAVWFFCMENAYFGWNATPQSDAELICDGIVLLICALSILFGKVKVSVEVKS